jgi:hypothetical protein
VLVFVTSDKGGTGRSVTSANIVYRAALDGKDVCYLDFDFGSPTAGSIFAGPSVAVGTQHDGLHGYLLGQVADAERIEVWDSSDREGLRARPSGAGRLVLLPGDAGGSEFPTSPELVDRCAGLFLRLEEEFDLTIVDLSAGRSYAAELVLAATASPALRACVRRWLVFHRWTKQHLVAASGLVYGRNGILYVGERLGHDKDALADGIRFVRTAVTDPNSEELAGLRPAQVAWLRECDRDLQQTARQLRIGRSLVLGSVPHDPVLQWREQLITDDDAYARAVANAATVEAFIELSRRLTDDDAWEGL